jgi:hypothetical protein
VQNKTIVQLQIFSGRRNPQWELTKQQKKAFVTLWNVAEIEEQRIKLPSHLGYQGFVVWDDTYKWIVYNGHIHCIYDNMCEIKKDKENVIEHFLKNTIPKNSNSNSEWEGMNL